MASILGRVKRITFRNAKSGYAVIKIAPEQNRSATRLTARQGLITAVGIMPNLEVNDSVKLTGTWHNHPQYGENFQVSSYAVRDLTTTEGLEKFLASKHIRGVGETLAARIVARFGRESFSVLSNYPERLSEIKGITQQRARQIARQWEQARAWRRQAIALQGLGIGVGLANKIRHAYGANAEQKVRENPYCLADDIWGVGFKTADRIAQHLGIQQADPRRIRAAIRYVLLEALNQGHLYLPASQLAAKTATLIGVSLPEVYKQIGQSDSTELVQEDGGIYLKSYYLAEQNLARRVNLIRKTGLSQSRLKIFLQGNPDWATLFRRVAKRTNLFLNAEQKQVVQTTLTHPLAILAGGPGTGKSTVIKALVGILQAWNRRFILAAPTGRAAKRITELTDYPASTIHRLLKLRPGVLPKYHRDNPLPADLVVVDESSMLDLLLAEKFFDAIAPGTHVLLVGDVDQLPSVQAGNVLQDIVNANVVPVVRLTQIFRQAAESTIILNAHRINSGQFPLLPKHPSDFYLIAETNLEKVASQIVELVSNRLPREFGYNPISDIQVLTPMYKTRVGVSELNLRLQSALNPRLRVGAENLAIRQFFPSDRVLQLVNNYEKEVFNGEVGQVVSTTNQGMRVNFDGREVAYQANEFGQLSLAYAISVHKSQGSEYPVVVMPVVTAHYIMLARNLLYTAITRAKKLVVLVGSKKALWMAIKNNRSHLRYSRLKQRLTGRM